MFQLFFSRHVHGRGVLNRCSDFLHFLVFFMNRGFKAKSEERNKERNKKEGKLAVISD